LERWGEYMGTTRQDLLGRPGEIAESEAKGKKDFLKR
jgi:hypothetical protein